MRSNSKPIVITLGDPAGIGPEVVAKALKQISSQHLSRYILIGPWSIFKKYGGTIPPDSAFIDPGKGSRSFITGQMNDRSAKASILYLDQAIALLKDDQASSLVTAPVCKEAIARFKPIFHGHTEYLAEAFNVKRVEMMFVAEKVRTVIMTRHIPVKEIPRHIRAQNVLETIRLTDRALKDVFKIRKPRLAVSGLNPHAGEGGKLGKEEATQIIPAVQKAKRLKIFVEGPFPADTLFIDRTLKQFDCVIAMYHDQGLGPIKAKYFDSLVNLTIGLPFIRTSPAHGTAFDIAGKNLADPSSMSAAIRLAAQLNAR